jgi:photosystem II stability/assembly factor-like uncharacterized protein
MHGAIFGRARPPTAGKRGLALRRWAGSERVGSARIMPTSSRSASPCGTRALLAGAVALAAAPACTSTAATPVVLAFEPLASPTRASLRGLSAVSATTVWASGAGGTVLRSGDGGATWIDASIAGAEALDHRSLHAFDAARAVVANAGAPARVFRTEDGGRTWEETHADPRPEAFFDAVDFWDERRGLVFGDPIGGRFALLATEDGGATWRDAGAALPAPLPGEAGFAASGACLRTGGEGRAWIGTGGRAARVLATRDFGATWRASPVPVAHGSASAGVFALAFDAGDRGVAVGGDYRAEQDPAGTAAFTVDGGATWQPAAAFPRGYRSGVAFVPGTPATFVAVGPTGCDVSHDGGRNWAPCAGQGFHTIRFAKDGTGYAAGADGRIARIALAR